MKKLYFLIGMMLISLTISCGGSSDEDEDLRAYTVVYDIKGTAETVDVTIENETGGTSQFSDVALPWQYKPFTAYEGNFVYVSAQNQDWEGSVTVYILVDYKVFKTSTSEGAFVIASASGSL